MEAQKELRSTEGSLHVMKTQIRKQQALLEGTSTDGLTDGAMQGCSARALQERKTHSVVFKSVATLGHEFQFSESPQHHYQCLFTWLLQIGSVVECLSPKS